MWVARCAACLLVGAASAAADAAGLLAALDSTLFEEEARRLLEPHMDSLKSLDHLVIEKAVHRQWWTLAREIVAKSHVQQVDLSIPVRRAVKAMKDEADELTRTLNPRYGLAQQVSPAFQWAQNDTCIFLTVKYTVRWNAPGALEATDINVLVEGNSFNFTGLGKHSNNKYKYVLGLSLFDVILPQPASSWSAASVGKLSVTLRKRWPRKWPRLLANKKAKISNMHVWMEFQEKVESTLSGMPTASNSPITCRAQEKLFCLATDTCKKEDCSQCPGKTTVDSEKNVCAGIPSEKAGLSFKDTDMEPGTIGGEVRINKARNEFDIDSYVIYWGKDSSSKLDAPLNPLLGNAAPTGSDAILQVPAGTPIPSTASHLLVFSKNEYGEYATPGSLYLKDAVMPKGKPKGIRFTDEDEDKGEVSGTVTILRAESEDRLDDYVLHWGKSATRKILSGSHIKDVGKVHNQDPTHYISRSTKIPEGATHLLAFAKNEFGENPSPASLKFVDSTKPCLARADADCPGELTVGFMQGKEVVKVSPAKEESSRQLTHYVLYWGRRECKGEGNQSGAKNGHIKDLEVTGGPHTFELPQGTRPEGTTHVLVFSKSKLGESDFCVSAVFEDKESDRKEL
jgi:hypothetical protein